MFISYASNSDSYRFLILKSNVLECNTVIETKKAVFLKHVFPLSKKISHAPTIVDDSHDEHGPIMVDDMKSPCDELRRRKSQRKEFYFGDYFYT